MVLAILLLLQDDTLITESRTFKPEKWTVEDKNDDGVLRIRGDGITVDFGGLTLVGAPDSADPDQYRGRGVVIEDSKNVTLRNLKVHRFKVGIFARNCPGLTIEDCDVSNNYRMRLHSTPEREAGEDWLWGHENDKNEWLRYGAGIYLLQCDRATVRRCRARNGQNGLCLVRCNDGVIIDNDLSFMSGWGLAMWRSSRNDVSNNKFDWCIRGFSYQVYHRGQDSAGILVYEQCNENVFAYNSATHGGDGFFLYAGNETLERTGKGGCNGNILYRNDFSHAAANGIEATFSDGNKFIENILEECDHGIWGGYSYNTVIVGNKIRNCNNGVSIEHGRDNVIEGNEFENNGIAVNLWWNDNSEFMKKPYGKFHDCKSENYLIARNRFSGEGVAIRLSNTRKVVIEENEMRVREKFRFENSEANTERNDAKPGPLKTKIEVPRTRGTQNAYLPKDALRGWRYIFVDEWGPYDFSRPRLFGRDGQYYVLASGGEFEVVEVKGGVTVEPKKGRVPGTIRVSGEGYKVFSFKVRVGAEVVTASGSILSARWEVKYFAWTRDPREDDGWKKNEPLHRETVPKIDYAWGGGRPHDKVPADRFATIATTEIDLPAGEYEIRTVSDDGIRVWVDDKLVQDDWTWHAPKENVSKVTLEAGRHRIRLEHFEIDGVAQLQFWLRGRP